MAGKLDINDQLVVVGNFGIYQWVCLFLNSMLGGLFAMQMFVMVFNHETPKFRCADGNFTRNSNSSVNMFDNECTLQRTSNDGVNISVPCERFVYDDSMFTETIATQFDLVCDRSYYVTAVNMAWMVSEGIGAVIGSYIADQFGRKPVIVVTYLVIGVFGIAAAFSVNYIMYLVLRCGISLVCFAGYAAALSLITECTSPNKRSHAINAVDVFWVIGSGSLSLWSYILPDWRHLQLAISVLALPTGLLALWKLDESPHWLLANGQKQKALDVLNRMARWNQVVAPDLIAKSNQQCHGEKLLPVDDDEDVAPITEGCCKIWKYPRVVVRFFVFSAGWISCAFCYYSLSFGVGNLRGSLYLNHFIMCAVEGAAYVSCFSIAWLGRKWPTFGSYLGGGLSLLISILLMVFVPEAPMAVTVLSFVGKFCVSAAWQVILVWQTEVYPTTHRCTLSALNGMVGRIGIVTAPYMVDLHKYIDIPREEVILPAIYVVLMVSVGLLHLIPPETNNRKLPETLAEANAVCFQMAKQEDELVKTDKLLAETAIDA